MIPARPLLPFGAPHVTGLREGTEYTVKVTDLMAVARGIVDGVIPLYGVVNGEQHPIIYIRESVVKNYYKSMGKAFNFPGIEVTENDSFSPIVRGGVS